MAPTRNCCFLPGDGIGPEVHGRGATGWSTGSAEPHGARLRGLERIWSAAAAIDTHGTPLDRRHPGQGHGGRCRAAGRGRRAQVGRSALRAEAGARPPGAAQGDGAVRQPAPGDLLRRPGRFLDPEARGGARPRYHDRARADRRRLFRRAARHRGPARRPSGAASTPRSTPRARSTGSPASPFELARKRGNRVCSVEKANVMESPACCGARR